MAARAALAGWLTDGAFGVGSRFREVRTMFGREAAEEFEVTACVPDQRLDLLVDGSKESTGRGTFRFGHRLEALRAHLLRQAGPSSS